MRAVLDQTHGDLAVEVLDAHGKPLRTVDGFEYGVELVSLPEGAAALRIRRVGVTPPSATYRLHVRVAPSGDYDVEDSVRAEDLSTLVKRLKAVGTRESLEQALALAQTAVSQWRDLGDDGATRRALIVQANIQHTLNQYDEARKLYGEALESSRTARDWRSAVECLNNRGIGFWQQGSFSAALDDLAEATKIWRLLPGETGQGATLNNLGILSWQVGEYEEALGYFRRALRLLHSEGDKRTAAYAVSNMASTYHGLGELALSALYFERAALAADSVGDHLAAARALNNSGRVYLQLRNPGKGEENVKRALVLMKAAGDRRALAEARNLLGELLVATGRSSEALEQQRQALELFRQVGDRRGEANAQTNLGLTYLAAGDRERATKLLEQALAAHRRLGTPASEASVAYHLAGIKLSQGDVNSAEALIGSAVSIAESLRGRLAGEDLRVSYLASTHEYYEAQIDILMRAGHGPGDEDSIVKAWQAAERSRARTLVEALRRRSNSQPGLTREHLRRLRQQVNAESVRLARATDGTEQMRSRLNSLTADLDAAEGQARGDPRYQSVFDPPLPALADVQRDLLDPDSVLLEYALGQQRSYLWLIRNDSIQAFPLPGRAALDRSVRLFRDSIRSDAVDAQAAERKYRRAARALCSALLGPAIPYLTAKRLLIVPDGSVHYAPFAALVLPDGKQLVQKYELDMLPSVATALAMRAGGMASPSAPRRLAILADPVFDAQDPRVERQSEVTGKPRGAESRFSRLPFSHREAMAIASLVRPDEERLFLGFDAAKPAVVHGALRDYAIVHIATHGVVDSAHPERSGLILSLVDRHGRPRPGLLSLDDIYRLNLNADLVTISACETALGREVRGEGLFSLTRGFLYAGANRVLATLWRVDDEATSDLLRNFYRALFQNPACTPATALRRAQLATMAQPRWRSPFYWAGFVLQGQP